MQGGSSGRVARGSTGWPLPLVPCLTRTPARRCMVQCVRSWGGPALPPLPWPQAAPQPSTTTSSTAGSTSSTAPDMGTCCPARPAAPLWGVCCIAPLVQWVVPCSASRSPLPAPRTHSRMAAARAPPRVTPPPMPPPQARTRSQGRPCRVARPRARVPPAPPHARACVPAGGQREAAQLA